MTDKLVRDFLMLWATIDPIGTLALFAVVTADQTPARRRRIALKAVLYATAILVGAIALGEVILAALGVRLISLQVAGGVILFLFGIQMIFGRVADAGGADTEAGHDVAVFPLAVPSIASPGAIMAVILLTDNQTWSVAAQIGTSLVLLVVLGATYVLMLLSNPILRVLGRNGANVLVRVMGMLLAALSVELVFNALGIARWLPART